ncbi:restriction endonuclease subunit S [Anoxybacillus flavithermus]|uniref:restriction endonuclease subunit S n=1 Tax=Anoxybacillus flavithermus TaxID=33934 RepID=UPI0018664BEF|nr:restriction endonuclease subunit S [Anoxybacillus flavithermus]
MGKEKITNANSFPKDWPIKKLADIGSTYGGLTNKSKEDFAEGNSKFITYKNIYNNTFINTNELESVRIYKDEKQNKVKYGDVFFTGSSETPDEVGISSVLLEEVDDVYLNSFCFGFRFNDLKKTIPEFYGYYFRGPVFRNEVYPLAQGSTRFNLSKSEMIKLKVPVPPVKEQYKIAAILSSVDEAIEKTEAIIEQTEKVKKGLMQQLLTKGIGHTKFKKTEIGEIPEQWEIRKLNQVSTRITEKNKGKTDRVLTISGLHGLVSQTEYFNKSVASKNIDGYYYLRKGDFAYNKSYSDGYPLGAIKMLERYPDGVVSTLYICFRINENMCKDYFRYYFESNLWNSEVSAIAPEGGRSHGLLNVGVNDFFNIFIPIPPIEEQYKISSIIRSVENKEKLELEKLEKLKTIKMGLMQVLLTGKVRVKVEDEVMSQ